MQTRTISLYLGSKMCRGSRERGSSNAPGRGKIGTVPGRSMRLDMDTELVRSGHQANIIELSFLRPFSTTGSLALSASKMLSDSVTAQSGGSRWPTASA